MSSEPQFTIEDAIKKFVDLRDEVDAIQTRADAECAEKKRIMKLIQAWLQNEFNVNGVTSFKTPAGTAYVETIKACKVDNWEMVWKFVQETGNRQLLTQGVSKKAVEEYIGEHNVVPPGVGWTEMRDVKVRRGK